MGTTETTLTLGTALREARLAAGFTTQQAAAKETPYREKDISRWESGSAIPRGDALVTLARLYAPHLDLTKVESYGPLTQMWRILTTPTAA